MSRAVKARKRAIEKEKQQQKRQRTLIGGVLGVLVLTAVLFTLFSGSNGEGETSVDQQRVAPEVGAVAPDFELTTKDGELVRLSDYRGRPVAVTFMHTW
ncbi:MAG: hypothetical protein D6816_12980 [Bacteroidetes bacterium]|nr:MAG: hypothetical protein D6816_12980 [Bacteroidota bacterium]